MVKSQKMAVIPINQKPMARSNTPLCCCDIAIIAMVISTMTGCIGIDDQLDCLNSAIRLENNTTLYKQVSQSLQDTIKVWIAAGAETKQGMRDDLWEIDAILFNTSRDRALILVPAIDKKNTAQIDFLHVFIGKKEGGTWLFHEPTAISVILERKDRPAGGAYTTEELTAVGKRAIVKGGYYKSGTCEIDDSYVLGWFKNMP